MMTEYIGDGVYVVFDGFGFELRANSHDRPTDTIYLEPEIMVSLNKFVERVRQIIKEANHD